MTQFKRSRDDISLEESRLRGAPQRRQGLGCAICRYSIAHLLLFAANRLGIWRPLVEFHLLLSIAAIHMCRYGDKLLLLAANIVSDKMPRSLTELPNYGWKRSICL